MTSHGFCLPCVADPWPLNAKQACQETESKMGEFAAKMTGEGNGILRSPGARGREGGLRSLRKESSRSGLRDIVADKLFSQRLTSLWL